MVDESPNIVDEPIYNTKAASLRTGVPADTLRAWERRYGVPKPHRTSGSQRLYSERDLAAIRWLKQQTDTGLTIKQAIALLSSTPEPPVSLPTAHEPRSMEEAAWALFQALSGLNSPEAERLLARFFAEYGIEATCIQVLQPVLYRIGEEWSLGHLPVSVEHFASYFIRDRLTGLVTAFGPSAGTLGPVITACAPDEQHENGILMLALFLIRRGIRVIHLGTGLPIADLAKLSASLRPQMVCLSASTPRRAEALIQGLEEWAAAGGELPPVCYGGYAFMAEPELRGRLNGLWLGQDALAAADEIHRMLASGHHATAA